MIGSMTTRRHFLQALAATLALPLAARAADELVVYKDAGCGCCGNWEKHMRANGFRVRSQTVDDIVAVKRKYGVPEALWSCHTALVGGYRIEGHVPAADVRRLLRERPKALGLAVPGMPIGSPGMEQGPPERYETIAFDGQRGWIFEKH